MSLPQSFGLGQCIGKPNIQIEQVTDFEEEQTLEIGLQIGAIETVERVVRHGAVSGGRVQRLSVQVANDVNHGLPHVLVVDTVEIIRHGFEVVIRDTLTFVRVAPVDVKSRVQLRQNGELSRSDIRRLNEEVLFDTTHVVRSNRVRVHTARH